jgi:mRNA interferase MazF
MELTPGEVFWAAPDATVGREQAGRRPVLIVAGELYLTTVTTLALVVPMTKTDRGWPNHVRVEGATDLPQPTFAMTEQIRAISRERLIRPAGHVTPACLDQVRMWLRDYLAD